MAKWLTGRDSSQLPTEAHTDMHYDQYSSCGPLEGLVAANITMGALQSNMHVKVV